MRYLGVLAIISLIVAFLYIDINHLFLVVSVITGAFWTLCFMTVWRLDKMILVAPTIMIPVFVGQYVQTHMSHDDILVDTWIWNAGMLATAGLILWIFKSRITVWCNLS